MAIITEVYVLKRNGTHVHTQKISLPQDDEKGFFGELSIKFSAGSVTSTNIPRQSLRVEQIGQKEWEKYFGKIEDQID